MASRPSQARAVAAATDDTAVVVEGREAVAQLALLVRAIDHANLWHELAWDGEQAAADAARDVARARRMGEMAMEWARERAGEFGR